MESGLYAAYTGLLARTQALDTTANNLSNANTNGFRAQQEIFRGVFAEAVDDSETSTISNAVNSYGILGGTAIDLGQGQITSTGNPLDLALDGQGFFAIQTKSGIRYTRDGSFLRASDGTLITRTGDNVLDANNQKIVLPSGNVHISPNGTVSVSDANGSAIIAQLGLKNFASSDLLTEGGNLFRARDGAKAAKAEATVEQGSLEGANQDAVHGGMQLLLIQRQAEMMQRALNVFSNDFDKTASEEIGRV